ncbi:hypothetical protein BLEM_1838 [Bifidobacterium lemurum]|uniref:Uncharacterized protein n=1 Tax=Bifidobacterium lemurum TaxID=1603886 RepID=A0A261FN10_9BIFI|nr:hypothetical protein [Bifidobacterium lemurum]OZG60537.1 hypothetical protein BLEM_1838 [Bifidobacterium lemurum]QOL34448.1 hypothetical protein BL8807_00455 [Bifidobacterium lemurum]
MNVTNDMLDKAVRAISAIPAVEMDGASLARDVVLLAYAWPDAEEFAAAVGGTCEALRALAEGRVEGSELKYQFEGWRSFHYQHRRFHKAKADARIVYRRVDAGIQVWGFGGRHVPSDIYRRLSRLQ